MLQRRACLGWSDTTHTLSWPSWPRRRKSRRPQNNGVGSARLCLAISISPLVSDVHKCGTTVLKDIQGKCVKVSRGSRLVVAEVQDGAAARVGQVDIWKKDNNIAFCFLYKNNSYLVTVNGNTLTLRKTTNAKQAITTPGFSSWFQKCNVVGSDHQYAIQTATSDSPKYLVINEAQSWSIVLSDTETHSAIFTTADFRCSQGCPGM